MKTRIYQLSLYEAISIKGALFALPMVLLAAHSVNAFQGVLAPGNGWGNFTGALSTDDKVTALVAVVMSLVAGHFAKVSVAIGGQDALSNVTSRLTALALVLLAPLAAAAVYVSFLQVAMRVSHFFGSGVAIQNELAQAGWMAIPMVCVALVYGQVVNGYMNR